MLTYRYNPAKEVEELYDTDIGQFVCETGPTDAEINATWAVLKKVVFVAFGIVIGAEWLRELVLFLMK